MPSPSAKGSGSSTEKSTRTFRPLTARTASLALPLRSPTVRFRTLLQDYNQDLFSGKKYIVLTTHSVLGGKNNTLMIAYMIGSLMSFLIAAVFFCKSKDDDNFNVLLES